MVRIPNKHLPHRFTVKAIKPVGGSRGAKYDEPKVVTLALVVDKISEVRDQREGETSGQVIKSSAHIVTHKENWAPPGSLITIHAGTPMERESEVIACSWNDHPVAPNSAQFWLV